MRMRTRSGWPSKRMPNMSNTSRSMASVPRQIAVWVREVVDRGDVDAHLEPVVPEGPQQVAEPLPVDVDRPLAARERDRGPVDGVGHQVGVPTAMRSTWRRAPG